MKLYALPLPLILLGLFGWGVSVAERTAVDGKLDKDAMIERVVKDYENVDKFMRSGSTANHGGYNS